MAAYATMEDLTTLGVPAKALASMAAADITRAITAASGVVDSYIGSRYNLPLVRWDASVSAATAKIAAYTLLTTRGYSAGTQDSEQFRLGYTDAIAWCKDVAKGLATPSVVETADSTAETINRQAAPFVLSSERRGW